MVFKNYTFISFLILFTACSHVPQPESYDPPGSTDTRNRDIEYQVKRTWRFEDGKINFSNEFSGARLSDVEQQNDTLYKAMVSAENYPVNKSPWYAFTLWGDPDYEIVVELLYPDKYSHRYYPKVKSGSQPWRPMDSAYYVIDTVMSTVTLRLKPAADTLFIAAQPLWTSRRTSMLTDSLARLPYVNKSIAGYSTLGKPIELLAIGNSLSTSAIVLLGRQHPPEVTGFQALKAFTTRLLESDSLAVCFRETFSTYLFPMLNPDGVDNGHWRHSAAGIDLNRDWYNFNQPETRAVRDVLDSLSAINKKLLFSIDFHSTQEDLFYVFDRDKPTLLTGFTHQWLDSLDARLDYYTADRVPTSGDSPVSTRFMVESYQTEAVTYEVGDHSPPEQINEISRAAAEEMMKILLSGNTN